MTSWQQLIPGCFAGMTAPFALHPKDEDRSEKMLLAMNDTEVTWFQAQNEVRKYLVSQNLSGAELTKQMERVERFLRGRLGDGN